MGSVPMPVTPIQFPSHFILVTTDPSDHKKALGLDWICQEAVASTEAQASRPPHKEYYHHTSMFFYTKVHGHDM